MFTDNRISERGQTIVLVVVSMMVMVVMAALVVDGGNMYLNRRQAQTAADAAALAGAYEYCVNKGSLADANDAATEYAVVQNGGTRLVDLDGDPNNSVEILLDAGEKSVTVEVEITLPTFFAKVLGIKEENVQATATADCLIPGGVQGNLAPIAWSCSPPLGGTVYDCNTEKIPYDIWQELTSNPAYGFNYSTNALDVGDGNSPISYVSDLGGNTEGKAIYVVMDTNSFDENRCILNGGTVDCDMDNDGQIDLISNGNRGWLHIEGNPSYTDDVMENGTDRLVPKNIWLRGEPGTMNNVMISAETRVGDIVLIPVYDKVCVANNPNNFTNTCDYDPTIDDISDVTTGQNYYYHVIDYYAFAITCVYRNGAHGFSCPGRDYAGLRQNDGDSIEGYFIDGFIADGIAGDGHDLGVYILSLTN